MIDETGLTGSLFHFTFLVALMGSALIVLVALWRHDRLDFDESPKMQMMEDRDDR